MHFESGRRGQLWMLWMFTNSNRRILLVMPLKHVLLVICICSLVKFWMLSFYLQYFYIVLLLYLLNTRMSSPIAVYTALRSCPHTCRSRWHRFAVKSSFLADCRTDLQLTKSVFLNNLYSVWRSHFKLVCLLYLMGLITMVITQDHILVNNCFVIAFR